MPNNEDRDPKGGRLGEFGQDRTQWVGSPGMWVEATDIKGKWQQ